MKCALRIILAVGMIVIGFMHFRRAEAFEGIVPPYLPAHRALVLISGFFEILGGLGLTIPRTRRWASLGLIALYIAVFPANVNMLLSAGPDASFAYRALLWARLPLQVPLIYWAWWAGVDRPTTQAD